MFWSRRRQAYGESKTGTRESKMDQIKVLLKKSPSHHNSPVNYVCKGDILLRAMLRTGRGATLLVPTIGGT